ncbi:hypothetical protein ACFVUP_39740, partial [Streptomyces bacillaris]|uniref:hypothetical protein n=1 Tax=Streptomyces bacillaris TaxID=68179 RepID=UPI0036DF470D
MNNKSWRGTVLFTIILVVMGATVGLKLYGVGEQTTAASSIHATTTTPSSTPSSTPSATANATPSASASAPAAAAPAT